MLIKAEIFRRTERLKARRMVIKRDIGKASLAAANKIPPCSVSFDITRTESIQKDRNLKKPEQMNRITKARLKKIISRARFFIKVP